MSYSFTYIEKRFLLSNILEGRSTDVPKARQAEASTAALALLRYNNTGAFLRGEALYCSGYRIDASSVQQREVVEQI